jgi:hypothetical protein
MHTNNSSVLQLVLEGRVPDPIQSLPFVHPLMPSMVGQAWGFLKQESPTGAVALCMNWVEWGMFRTNPANVAFLNYSDEDNYDGVSPASFGDMMHILVHKDIESIYMVVMDGSGEGEITHSVRFDGAVC